MLTTSDPTEPVTDRSAEHPAFTLLVIEDNPDDHYLLGTLLDGLVDRPDQVVSAESLAEAKQVARRCSPSLILADLNLADSRGLDTLARIRSMIPGVPVVVLTGQDEDTLALAAVREGAQDYLIKGRVDAWTLGRTMRHALERHRLVVELEASRARESHRATHDTMTGLPNRALFDDRLRHGLARVARQRSELAVVFLDLDGFKPVNDQFGHAAGDAVLTEVARRLASVTRSSDTVARLGGDEFGVILENIPNQEKARTVAEMLRARLAQPIVLPQGSCTIGVSLGIAFYPEDDQDAAGLVHRADGRMYADKQQRKQH